MEEDLKLFQAYCEENPLEFQAEQLEKIKEDIIHARKGVVYDETVEFRLWLKGLNSRQEYFSEYVTKLFPEEKYHRLLEVGCGRTARLSRLLGSKGYKMTAMDPEVAFEGDGQNGNPDRIVCRKEAFLFGKTEVGEYDAVVAQEPCDATEHIVRACVAARKNFLISLCGTPHQLISGEWPEDVYQWYEYLEQIDGEHCILLKPELIPGYLCYVLVGIYEGEEVRK